MDIELQLHAWVHVRQWLSFHFGATELYGIAYVKEKKQHAGQVWIYRRQVPGQARRGQWAVQQGQLLGYPAPG